ncbi:MAG TPA: PEP-CTERM sorting domain-containing protein [Opitutaceae bacterium]|nr:PEP-CTERM sorting domain-containing protein [Opitutaceae bacterium]
MNYRLIAATTGLCAATLTASAVDLLTQDWSNTALIVTNDDWSALWNGSYGIIGYRGDSLGGGTGFDPQSVLGDSSVVDVNANLLNPNTFATGGIGEFELTDPTIALQGSGTAAAPYLLLSFAATGYRDINISYTLRDIDGSTDNSVQQLALQYRLGSAGSWTNLPAGYVADASAGPSLAGMATPVSVNGPTALDDQSMVQFRILTTNAVGSDEWIGVDNIVISGTAIPEPSTYAALCGVAALALAAWRRRS